MITVSALFVEPNGPYFGLEGVDPWDEARDARTYEGPHPVVAHPPCERWGRYAHGGPSAPGRFRVGDDGGCFEAALSSVRAWGGVLEHPANSLAWEAFGLTRPTSSGWGAVDDYGGASCRVDQGSYGHSAKKSTWLYVVGACKLPELAWRDSRKRARIHRLDGRIRAASGDIENLSKRQRRLTPIPFRDLLVGIARSCEPNRHRSIRLT